MAPVTANAGVIIYSDRASFEASLSSFTVQNFDDLCISECPSLNLGTSATFGAATYSNPNNVYATNGDATGAPTTQVGDQNGGVTTITLDAGYNALGMDLGLIFGAGNIYTTL